MFYFPYKLHSTSCVQTLNMYNVWIDDSESEFWKKFIFQLQISLRNGRNFKMKKVKGEYHWQPNPHLKMEMSKSTNQSRCITPKSF